MKRVDVDNLQLVSEEIVQYCADVLADDEDNSFKRILGVAEEFREVGLTPVFLCSHTLQDLFVTTKEKLQKKLH
jgi:hypothetical protein